MTAEHRLMAWLSPAYPVGAFAYSHGLETAVADGRVTAATATAWVAGALTLGSGRTDAVLMARAARGGDLAALAALAEALAPSAERAEEARAMGTALAETLAAAEGIAVDPAPWPVALGAAAHTAGIPAERLVPLALHAAAASWLSALVRLVPLGPAAAQGMLAGLWPAIDALAAEALHPGAELGGCAQALDIASLAHETLPVRLFRS